MQVRLARIQASSALRLRSDTQVNVRVSLVVVEDHHVLVIIEFGLSEFPRCSLDDQRVNTAGHRQNDVERLASRAGFGYQ
jgi:hypothetical protein